MEKENTQKHEELETEKQEQEIVKDDNDVKVNDNNEPKTFTQEEVDEIIKIRLGRERNKFEKTKNKLINESEFSDDLKEREKAITLKEKKFEYALKIQDQGLPLELVDYIDYSDPEKADQSFDGIVNLFEETLNKLLTAEVKKRLGSHAIAPPAGGGVNNSVDTKISEIFKKK